MELVKKYTCGGDRTHDQQLKRLSLYRLSYAGNYTCIIVFTLVVSWVKGKKLRRPGIEPGPPAWKADILPLNYRRGLENRIVCWNSAM